jgi:hypothetical protein
MRRALHLGVQKALGVVRSHYEVNFKAVASGYVTSEGVEDKAAMEHVDTLAADASEKLTGNFMELLFPDTVTSTRLKPEGRRAPGLFFCSNVSIWATWWCK